jgi:endonuclease G
MDDTFSLSNVAPQVGAGFNRDYWARFEKFVKDVAKTADGVYVVTGPLYLPSPAAAGDGDAADGGGFGGGGFSGGGAADGGAAVAGVKPAAWRMSYPLIGAWCIRAFGPSFGLVAEKAYIKHPRHNTQHTTHQTKKGTPPSLVAVPTHFFKVILADNASGAHGRHTAALGAFVVPNAPVDPDVPLSAFAVPLDALERAAGACG